MRIIINSFMCLILFVCCSKSDSDKPDVFVDKYNLTGTWYMEKPGTFLTVTHYYSDGRVVDGYKTEKDFYRFDSITFSKNVTTGKAVVNMPHYAGPNSELAGSHLVVKDFTFKIQENPLTILMQYDEGQILFNTFYIAVSTNELIMKSGKLPIKTNAPNLQFIELTMALKKKI